MAKSKEAMMREAVRLSVENVQNHGGPFGAVIVRDGQIISTGVNEVISTHDPTAHAEIQAIRKASREVDSPELTDCEIYCSCEPCPMCLGAIYWAGIRKIYYAASREDAEKAGFRDNHIYREMSLPPEKRSIPAEQMMREEAGEAFRAWMDWEERIEY
ncbi:MAG TPA: nucleoside deaminase [Bacteroidetes bacterium]|nr:nucleoside deaminase [Bacteroidota bacterium]